MNHVELAKTETWNHNPHAVTCYLCGVTGTGYLRDGWDSIGDDDGDHDVCGDCLAALDDDDDDE